MSRATSKVSWGVPQIGDSIASAVRDGGREKQTLIIHIGFPKTGTSSIQAFLHIYRSLWRFFGLIYPTLDRFPNYIWNARHFDIFDAIRRQDRQLDDDPASDEADRLIDAYGRLIESSSAQIAVLSAEAFSGTRENFPSYFAPLKDRFNVHVVCFLRRQDYFVEAFYKQMVKSRSVRNHRRFNDFTKTVNTRLRLDYFTILERWAKVFGDSAIKVIPYEPARASFDLMNEFIQTVGLPERVRWLPFFNRTFNRSISREATEEVRRLNASGELCTKGQISRIARRHKTGNVHYFGNDDRLRFMENYADINRRIARRFLGREELFQADPERSPDMNSTWIGSRSKGRF